MPRGEKVEGNCPRRAEVPPQSNLRDYDYWSKQGELLGVTVRTCSFCGGIHPEDFLSLWEKGVSVGPTDKSYKLYVDEAGKVTRGSGKFYLHHLNTADWQAKFKELADDALSQVEPDYEKDGIGSKRGREDGPKIGYPWWFYSKVYMPEVAS